jgi:hypothetical protein
MSVAARRQADCTACKGLVLLEVSWWFLSRCDAGYPHPDKSAASVGNPAFSRTESGTALFGVDISVRDR